MGVLRRTGRRTLLEQLGHDDTETSCGDPLRGSQGLHIMQEVGARGVRLLTVASSLIRLLSATGS